MTLRKNGFTLVEVMIAVVIITLLLTTIYGVFTSVSRAKERLESDGEGYHQARVLFDRIGREIRGAYVTKKNPDTLFLGGVNRDGNPYLTLTTTAVTPQGGGGTGIAVVRYELVEDRETPGGGKVLMRSEYALFDPEGPDRPAYRLATSIEALTFGFFDGLTWQTDWDYQQGGMPKLVEVSLGIKIGEEAVPFRSAMEAPEIQ